METAIMALVLLMAFTGFFMLVGSFGILVYEIYRRGRESGNRSPGTAGEGVEPGPQ